MLYVQEKLYIAVRYKWDIRFRFPTDNQKRKPKSSESTEKAPRTGIGKAANGGGHVNVSISYCFIIISRCIAIEGFITCYNEYA